MLPDWILLGPRAGEPIWGHAANRTGRLPCVALPTYAPERIARIAVNQIRRPRREVVAGGVLTRQLLVLHKVFPGVAERMLATEVAHYARATGDAEDTAGTWTVRHRRHAGSTDDGTGRVASDPAPWPRGSLRSLSRSPVSRCSRPDGEELT